MPQGYKVVDEVAEITLFLPQKPCRDTPIWKNKTKKRCKECPQTHRINEKSHEKPVNWYKPQYPDIKEGAQAENKERIEIESYCLIVLICLVYRKHACHKTQLHDGTINRRKEETGCARQDYECCRHRTAVNTYQHILIVDYRHQGC